MTVADAFANRLDAYQGGHRSAIPTLAASFTFTWERPQSNMSQWLEAARVGEIANRKCKAITINGSAVALFNLDGEYFAIDDLCTHLGSDLSSGWLEGDRAVLPVASGRILHPHRQGSQSPGL